MNQRSTRIFLLLALFTFGITSGVAAQHSLVLQGGGKLAIVAADGTIEAEMPWQGIHDVHALANGNFMVQQGASKVVEVDLRKHAVVWSYDAAQSNGNAGQRVEVHAFQPLDNDRVMIAESGPARIIEIDRSGKLLAEVRMKVNHPNPHTDTRLVPTQNGQLSRLPRG